MEFASQVIAGIGRFYSADSPSTLDSARANLLEKFARLEQDLGVGPWFANDRFTLVDAAFAPAFRYFDTLEGLTGFEVLARTPKVARWRKALSERRTVKSAVSEDYPERLLTFLANRDSIVGRIAQTTIEARPVAA